MKNIYKINLKLGDTASYLDSHGSSKIELRFTIGFKNPFGLYSSLIRKRHQCTASLDGAHQRNTRQKLSYITILHIVITSMTSMERKRRICMQSNKDVETEQI